MNFSHCATEKKKTTHSTKDDANGEKQHKSSIINGIDYSKRIKARRERWKRTFSEIKSIVVKPERTTLKEKDRTKLFDQWKLFTEQSSSSQPFTNSTDDTSVDSKRFNRSRQRFEGFQSWEKLTQQWSEDTKYYMNAKESLNDNAPNNNTDFAIAEEIIHEEMKRVKKPKFSPKPAKAGEAILPHTDIGDKSKKIWIVTTASLPWMTGTAVNPLLRAAFLTSGRKEAGGKVTLMLPWLEREKDRDKIYGKGRAFDTSNEQEAWIRSWLRDTAGLKEASELLNIAWYIGRHETQENSIYSMGDITAIIQVSFSSRSRF